MVWIVSDDAMKHIMGGDFSKVMLAYNDNKDISIRRLYNVQQVYKSYQGFRKFFKIHMKPIIEKISYIDDNSINSRIIRYFVEL